MGRAQRVEPLEDGERRLGLPQRQGIAAHEMELTGLVDQAVDLVGQGGEVVAADRDALLQEVVGVPRSSWPGSG